MYLSKRIICVVPARLKSSRFPGKILKSLCNKPILEWIYDSAKACNVFDEIIFAVDSQEAFDLVKGFNGNALMTDINHQSGTDRLIEVKSKHQVGGDIWVNWQGDEPLIEKPLILDLLSSIDAGFDIWTLKQKITDPKKIEDPSVVQVVCDHEGSAMYFSRCSIPYDVEDSLPKYKHIGIYAYTSCALDQIKKLKPCEYEKREKLEQLRFLYHGMKIKVHETSFDTFGIDEPHHLIAAEEKALKRLSVLTS